MFVLLAHLLPYSYLLTASCLLRAARAVTAKSKKVSRPREKLNKTKRGKQARRKKQGRSKDVNTVLCTILGPFSLFGFASKNGASFGPLVSSASAPVTTPTTPTTTTPTNHTPPCLLPPVPRRLRRLRRSRPPCCPRRRQQTDPRRDESNPTDETNDAISSASPQAAWCSPLKILSQLAPPRFEPPSSRLTQAMGRQAPPTLAHHLPSLSRPPRCTRSYPRTISPRHRFPSHPRCIRRHAGPLGLRHALVCILYLQQPIYRSFHTSSPIAAISTPEPIPKPIGGLFSSVHLVNNPRMTLMTCP
jgi:hypothetical protein